MMKRESKKRRLYLCWLAMAMLVVVFTATAFAQEDPNDPVLPDPNMPEELRLPGTVEGTGTYFEVTDSNYLNITFESSEPVHLRLESVPEMVIMDINSAEGATSTQITLTGFEASTTYYKYEDDYHNGVAFATDDNGTYTFAQDLSQPHFVFIQPNPCTIFIPTDTSVGMWDPVNRIYTLTTDVYETIQIDQDNLTLDGAGHNVTGTGSGLGIYLPNRAGVTIKNVNVLEFSHGIDLYLSNNNTLTGNMATSNYLHSRGIRLDASNHNTLTGNTTNSHYSGIWLQYSSNNTLTDNMGSSNGAGIYLGYSNNNTLTSNSASNNAVGISVAHSSNNILTDNIISNSSSYGISIWNYSSNNDLRGNNVSNNRVGIFVEDSSTNILTGNTTKSNYYWGIYIRRSECTILTGNTAESNGTGIYIGFSNAHTVTDNIASWNETYGIKLSRANNSTLTGNTFSNNITTGIEFSICSDNKLTGNTVSNNNGNGITLGASSNNTLTANSVSNNTTGIFIDYTSTINQIYNNNFIDNTTQIYVWQGSSGNIFNLEKPIGGNYWSNWMSPDNNGDGFVDYPYVFTGGQQDNLSWARQDGWVAAGVTWTGTDVVVQPEDQTTGQTPVTLTFDEVTEVGLTTVTSTTPGEQQGAPEGFRVGQPPTIFNISTTATFTGYVLICINYSGISFHNESTLELFHYENGEWVPLTTVLDTENNIICSEVTSLSPFAIFEPDNKLPVSIDIKPGSYPNAINLGSYGLVPVAILSSEDFDATTTDPDTVELAGSDVAVRGKSNKFMSHAEDVNGDGLVDLLLQVATQNLDPGSLQDGYAVLTGETYDGVSIEGEDEITIVPPEP